MVCIINHEGNENENNNEISPTVEISTYYTHTYTQATSIGINVRAKDTLIQSLLKCQ